MGGQVTARADPAESKRPPACGASPGLTRCSWCPLPRPALASWQAQARPWPRAHHTSQPLQAPPWPPPRPHLQPPLPCPAHTSAAGALTLAALPGSLLPPAGGHRHSGRWSWGAGGRGDGACRQTGLLAPSQAGRAACRVSARSQGAGPVTQNQAWGTLTPALPTLSPPETQHVRPGSRQLGQPLQASGPPLSEGQSSPSISEAGSPAPPGCGAQGCLRAGLQEPHGLWRQELVEATAPGGIGGPVCSETTCRGCSPRAALRP